jgi:radical SAM-linked protein
MERRINLLRGRLARRGIQFKWNQPFQSMLEGVFARGDRRLAALLLRAQRLGCRFDGWSEQLRPDLWRTAFAEEGIDPTFYAARRRTPEEALPWSHLDCGVARDYLWQEYERALAGQITGDCRLNGCTQCGMCEPGGVGLRLQQDVGPLSLSPPEGTKESNGAYRYRLVFAKTEQARFLGHLDMVTVLLRAMRRARLPLAYSQGHHPAPRLSLGDALPLGIESRDETMEIVLSRPLEPPELARRLNTELPAGLAILEVQADGARRRPPDSHIVTYEAVLPGREWPADGFRRYQERDVPALPQKSKRGIVLIPLEEKLRALERLAPDRLRCALEQTGECTIRVRELLAHLFGLAGEELLTTRILKVSTQDSEGQ